MSADYSLSKKDKSTTLEKLEYQELAAYGSSAFSSKSRKIIQNQKELIDNLSANVIKVKEERNKNLLNRISEAKNALPKSFSQRLKFFWKMIGKNPLKKNLQLLSAYETAIETIEPNMKGCVTVLSDTHGDALSLLATVVNTGAVKVVPRQYLYLDFTTGDIFANLDDIPEGHKIMLLPKLVRNEDFKGRIVHLGDLIDRGAESALSLALAIELNDILREQIDFVVGNHEVTNNDSCGTDIYEDELKVCIQKKLFKPSVTIEDAQGNKTYLSHDQFTKLELPIMAEVFADMMSGVNIDDILKQKRLEGYKTQIKERLREAYTTFQNKLLEIAQRERYKSLLDLFQGKTRDEIYNYINDYEESKEDNLYLIRDLFIETHVEVFGETGKDYTGNDFSDLNSIYPRYLTDCGPFFIANRNPITKDTAFKSRKNIFGHTTNKQATQAVENYTCVDTKRSSGNSIEEGKDYTIAEGFVIDQSGEFLYSDAFAISRTPGEFTRLSTPTREKTHTIMSPDDKDYKMYELTNVETNPRNIKPGIQTQNKKKKYRNLSSLAKTLHAFYPDIEKEYNTDLTTRKYNLPTAIFGGLGLVCAGGLAIACAAVAGASGAASLLAPVFGTVALKLLITGLALLTVAFTALTAYFASPQIRNFVQSKISKSTSKNDIPPIDNLGDGVKAI